LPGIADKPRRRQPDATPIRGKIIRIAKALLVTAEPDKCQKHYPEISPFENIAGIYQDFMFESYLK